MDLFLQTALNGILIGGILASLTLGFQLTFGVLHVIDFAVGGVLVAGVFLGLIEALVATYVGASYSHLVVFGVLYLVLLVSPQGILRRGL